MLEKKELLENLKKDLNKLDFKVKHPHLYNAQVRTKKYLLTAGMLLVFSIPTVFAVTGAEVSCNEINHNPFKKDMVEVYEEVGTTRTSNGYFSEERLIYYGINEFTNSLSISTGWQLNSNGNYERTETYFNHSDLDLSDYETILAMSEDEIRENFKVTKKNTIQKSKLSDNDDMYNEDAIIINYHYKNKDVSELVEESSDRNGLSIVLFLLMTAGYTWLIRKGVKIIFKKFPSDRIKEKIETYTYVTKKDLEELQELLKTKKTNYDMLINESIEGPVPTLMK